MNTFCFVFDLEFIYEIQLPREKRPNQLHLTLCTAIYGHPLMIKLINKNGILFTKDQIGFLLNSVNGDPSNTILPIRCENIHLNLISSF